MVQKFSATRRRPRVPVIILIVLLHVLVFYGLLKALAPSFTSDVEETVLSAVTVTVTTPPEDMPEIEPEPDEGLQGDPGQDAVPKPTSAPTPKRILKEDKPLPKATSTGTENRSGANDSGDGTGRAGTGLGTGAGSGGTGRGSGAVATKPSVRSGTIDQARDFPVPEGGRKTRFGKSVTVAFTVTTEGRAKNCAVRSSSADAQTTALACSLVQQKIRFNPAKDANGNPVEARYGYRIDFNAKG